MRIVAGKYKGKNLKSPVGEDVRPTTTRIKETLFNVLQGYVADSVALDLFAGSGALGIECLSRGAKEVVFVDKSKASIDLVHENLKGIDGNYTVQNTDFASALRSFFAQNRKFDLIFLDPPYSSGLGELAIEMITELDLLSDDGFIVFEHGAEKTYTLTDSRFMLRTKKMGTITAEFIKRRHVALMTGSFDPVTRGHEELLKATLDDYDEVVVACLVNTDKTYTFNAAQRLALAQAMCSMYKGARAIYSDDSAVNVAKQVGAEIIVRGVRNADDLKYETDMAAYNSNLGVDTRFIKAEGYGDISSTSVRAEIANGKYGGLPPACVPVILSDEFKTLK